MDPITQQQALAAAGAAGGGESLYVDDVFSTYLYEGNGSTQTITNGIDLAGEGGLVWTKWRSGSFSTSSHRLFDSARGLPLSLSTDTTGNSLNLANSLTTFNADGFSFGGGNSGLVNWSGENYASWTFRKAPGFFDVVTYTGNGTAGRTVSHNLGSVPGMIIVKKTNNTGNWAVYHRSLGNSNALYLNTNGGSFSSPLFNNTTPTSTEFTLNNGGDVNGNGDTYVAYIFAHDDAQFGENSDESIIKCGTFTTDGSGNVGTVNLGWEPQYIITKKINGTQNWFAWDIMRRWSDHQLEALRPDTSATAQSWTRDDFYPTATGLDGIGNFFGTNAQMIYIAIRRPHKPPEAATDVFAQFTYPSTDAGNKKTTGFPVDLSLQRVLRTGTGYGGAYDRLRGSKELRTNATSAETLSNLEFDFNDGYIQNFSNSDGMSWNFRRAPGFFDVVAYTGTGSNPRSITHGLSVAPELVIVKNRSQVDDWWVYVGSAGITKRLVLNNSNSIADTTTTWGNTAFTSTTFGVGDFRTNTSGNNFIAYLFATLAGISKVGSFSGTGSNVDVDCGFTAGARFVLIKRTDSTGDWYVWDSTRGIVSGNDPYLLLNSTAAEVTSTDYIDPLNSGFTVTSSAPAALNTSGGKYIFLAIA